MTPVVTITQTPTGVKIVTQYPNGVKETETRSAGPYQCTPEEYQERITACSSCSEYVPESAGCKACRRCNTTLRLSRIYNCPLLKW